MQGFKRKTIINILSAKVEKLIDSITDNEIKQVIRDHGLITGGAISSLIRGEKPNDYDFYFKSKDAAAKVLNYYLANTTLENSWHIREDVVTNIRGEEEERLLLYIKSEGIAELDEEENTTFEKVVGGEHFKPRFFSQNSITLNNKVQIIFRFFGTSAEIHKNFDYVHCMGVYDIRSRELHISQETYEACVTKSLIYNGSLYPYASVMRLRKFLPVGWRISVGQIVKIMYQAASVDISNPKIMAEQLMGVDIVFMRMAIQALQDYARKGSQLDSLTFFQLLDKVFEDTLEPTIEEE